MSRSVSSQSPPNGSVPPRGKRQPISRLIEIIESDDDAVRNIALDAICRAEPLQGLLQHADALDQFRRRSVNLYHRVRALFFLSAIYRYHLPKRLRPDNIGRIPFAGYEHLLQRRYAEAIDRFLASQQKAGTNDAIASALAEAYQQLAFQTLADQVRRSVRSFHGNQWMFRVGHPDDHPLRFRPELLQPVAGGVTMPILFESTAVRMDFSHSAWSDIFFLGMDFPEGARVLNVSIDLGIRGRDPHPRPPLESYLRVIDRPVIRLVSVDLGASVEIESIAQMFDFARDHLGLLKAAVIASGIVPLGLEGCDGPMAAVLERLVGPGRGIELVSKVNDIPKGSRLAVSTNLLGSLISICMRATSQVASLSGPLQERDRRTVAARAILGEWLGGSGGGWQDSGGIWPGIKKITGVKAAPGDPEHGISRGCLMPVHRVLDRHEVSQASRQKLRDSLVLVHGGMAQNVGPILEMVTEHYLLRNETQWQARQTANRIFDEVVDALAEGDVKRIGAVTTRNFEEPLQTIIPWATNHFTDSLIAQCRDRYKSRFWGFWMLGGMAGGGMGFIFDPAIKAQAQDWLLTTMRRTKQQLETALPFAMDPVVYDFEINDQGTSCRFLTGEHCKMPDRYYALMLPQWLRSDSKILSPQTRREMESLGQRCRTMADDAPTSQMLIESLLPRASQPTSPEQSLDGLLRANGFDPKYHEQIRSDLRDGRIGLAQNRLPRSTTIEDVLPEDVDDFREDSPDRYRELGENAIREGRVAVVTLAAGVGSRWTQGAGVCKALHPFCRFAGRHRSFLEVHLAKTRRTSETFDAAIPHLFTTGYMTEQPIREQLARHDHYGFSPDLVRVSPGLSVGLRTVPTVGDLRFAWEEVAQQVLDEQQQKVRESARAALIDWARRTGEASDYTDNTPLQCLHPVGHWYEIPNLLRNGILHEMLIKQPSLQSLLLHNIDTLGASVDPSLLGHHIASGCDLNFEVIARRLDDRGGGLARVNGRPQLVEGMALPDESIEFGLSYYNSMTTWIDIDRLLAIFQLSRESLSDGQRVERAVRTMAQRMPTYVTIKEVKKRWGHGQEDIFPVAQFEKLWGDMTAIPQIRSGFFVVPLVRGQQLKQPAQLDGWLRDGSAAQINALCRW